MGTAGISRCITGVFCNRSFRVEAFLVMSLSLGLVILVSHAKASQMCVKEKRSTGTKAFL